MKEAIDVMSYAAKRHAEGYLRMGDADELTAIATRAFAAELVRPLFEWMAGSCLWSGSL